MELPDSSIISLFHNQWSFLKENASVVANIEYRTRDVLKPLFEYKKGDIQIFDQTNMCLLEDNNILLLNSKILSDIYHFFESQRDSKLGINWFWMHQMVHITQGLSYQSFRQLNKNTDRSETMRADCWADFISLKTLALSELIKSGVNNPTPTEIQSEILDILTTIVIPMITMKPNIFIPNNRDMEIKRIFSLIVMEVVLKKLKIKQSKFILDDSIFVNWRRDFERLYIWYGQTSLLGKESICIPIQTLDDILYSIRYGNLQESYGMIAGLNIPSVEKLESIATNPW